MMKKNKKSKIKIIFLDIDGVLNNEVDATYSTLPDKFKLSLHCIDSLKYILYSTDAKIVVSSTWRLGETVESLKQNLFRYYDLDEYIIGITPYFPDEIRGTEIRYFLNQEHDFVIDEYAILDDDSDMGDLFDHQVLVDNFFGLTTKDSYKAINLLNNHQLIN